MQITIAEARAYALKRPQTTPRHLRERFQDLNQVQARNILWKARKAAKANGVQFTIPDMQAQASEVMVEARAYAEANPTIAPAQLRQLFAITLAQSHKAVRLAREATGVKPAPRVAPIRKQLPVKLKVAAAPTNKPQPKRERWRFRQITDADYNADGSRVLDDVVRFPSRLGFAVFREVR
jgi:hypothetical protein